MRAVLAGRSAGIRVLAGTAERMPLHGRLGGRGLRRRRVPLVRRRRPPSPSSRASLRPRGGVALLWNHWWSDGDDRTVNTLEPPLPAEAQALFDEIYFSSGRAAARAEMADPLDAFAGEPFEPLAEEAFARSKQLVAARRSSTLYATVSSVASLPPDEREELKRAVLALLAPSYRLEITTVLHWTRRA